MKFFFLNDRVPTSQSTSQAPRSWLRPCPSQARRMVRYQISDGLMWAQDPAFSGRATFCSSHPFFLEHSFPTCCSSSGSQLRYLALREALSNPRPHN